MELLDYEKRHIDYLLSNAGECALFLKRDDEFPLEKPCSIVLVGNGVRHTVKGGTGSGDVPSRYFDTVEQGFLKAGFTITSNEWLDKYDEFLKTTKKPFIKETKRIARKAHIGPYIYSMGYFDTEKNYEFDCESYDGEACIYVLTRNSGEGNDRRNEKGDVKLSDREVKDILFLNNKYKKFLLVLNVGGPVDLSSVQEVRNILLLSQLGVVTSNVLADIVLGKVNPSGKLSTTWAKPEDYLFFNEFGDLHDTYYKEGIYVGYRYFLTAQKDILYPFGYGLSYSDFEIEQKSVSVKGSVIEAKALVKNISKYVGKEVVQFYLTKPNDRIDNPYVELCGYTKTELIETNSSSEVSITFDLLKFASYDESYSCYVLPKGKYIVHLGNSSTSIKPILVINLENDLIVEQLQNKCGKSGFIDYQIKDRPDCNIDGVQEVTLSLEHTTKTVEYKLNECVEPVIEKLSNEDLADVCLGTYGKGWAAVVGQSCQHIIGGAGETVLRIPEINKSLTMADGPAGIRLKRVYGVDKKGIYDVELDLMMEKMIDYLPCKPVAALFVCPPKNRHGEIHYQYSTAIPIGTALAQSFNNEFVRNCGDIVGEEMDYFGVDLWLAPALNIHRNILCGRNFEYYSEDPFLSGMIAASMTRGVEAHPGRGVTVKHFACNNQELNRNNNNSHLSERALREIYLRGFEICIKEANPKALMTSYNLINGVHASENYELLNDILRCEWDYDGLIMTDWIASGRSWCKKSKYDAPYASNNIKAGNDLTMPGCPKDHKDIMKGLKKGKITRNDLINSASRIYRSIMRQKA